MIKKLLGMNRVSEVRPVETPSLQEDEIDVIKDLIEFFPIGKKQRYYPEFKKSIVLNTFILGYCVNGRYIYSVDGIKNDDQGALEFFCEENEGERISIFDVELFQFLVPDTSDLELQLDYESRALIGRGRQFVKGNGISLIASASGRGAATVDTEVAAKLFPKEGPYEQTKLILLTPELASVVVTDQRKIPRAKVCVPVMVSVRGGPMCGACQVVDISNKSLRIRLQDRQSLSSEIAKGSAVVLVINLAGAEQEYIINGTVIRSFPEIRVIQLDGLLKNGRVVPFGPMDHLELKAGLLNYTA